MPARSKARKRALDVLYEADLREANLCGAVLREANLRGAVLCEAKFLAPDGTIQVVK